MESYYPNEQQAFLMEELMGSNGRDMEAYYTNQAYIAAINGYLSLESFYNNNSNFPNINNPTPNSSFENYNPNQITLNHHQQSFVGSSYAPFGDDLSPPDLTVDSSSSRNVDAQSVPYGCPEADNRFYLDGGMFRNVAGFQNMDIGAPCKMEPLPEMPGAYNLGFGQQIVSERKSKVKKVSGQPSKNLMAERRRRKRLNDRLSMLRSVVPKISKMDRTSILGDTIDYVKELIERINGLQKEMHLGSNQLSEMSIFNDVKPNEIVVRNSPKFGVERRNADTRVEICCGAKQDLLLSTVTTLEALGLEIKQCVISCFNEFSVQASCSEEMKKRAILDSEDVRQALLRNAGYGEKCL
ncbi:hypothetical protein CASFOL_021172 [Castilleja foliolosa]|uniref:BHLH domain-containing protein n=1 Tax=Castilleja foliolosa TaxID=1961234 RepID=A0ABD3CVT1_9LAMI